MKLLGSEWRLSVRQMAARLNKDSQAAIKDFNCYITLWTQDQIYFIYDEYLIAICIIDTVI